MRKSIRGLCGVALLGIVAAPLPLLAQNEPDAVEPTSDDAGGAWEHDVFGYVRVAWETVQDDPDLDFVGHNDGFVVQNARIGVRGGDERSGLAYVASLEGAADLRGVANTPQGETDVRLRDAFLRYRPHEAAGVQIGQFEVPFAAEELRSTAGHLFASDAVGQEGVLVGRGLQQEGIAQDRQLGVMIGSLEPFDIHGVRLGWYGMASNGNGLNEALNDNQSVMLIGRIEAGYGDWVLVGASVLSNDRTEGVLPNRFEEQDRGLAFDVRVEAYGVEAFFQYAEITTSFETIATDDRRSVAWHGEVGYTIDQLPKVELTPSYRYAWFDAWAGADNGVLDLADRELVWQTAGVRVHHDAGDVGLTGYINYTWAGEAGDREVDNDRLELVAQVAF